MAARDPDFDENARQIAAGPQALRAHFCTSMVVTVALGLASREVPGLFPAALGQYPGDALWSLMVYWGIAWLIPSAPVKKVAVPALLVSYADEVSQLYQAPWLNAIRMTTVGHLVLGSVFSWLDMLAYTIGVAAGATIEYLLRFVRHP